jgi:hypothetical protein
MKKVFFILALLSGTVMTVNAQDIITKKDGSKIEAVVTKVDVNDVKYKLFNDASGEIRSLSKSQITIINYEDGTADEFNVPAPVVVRSNDSDSRKISSKSNAKDVHRKGYVGIAFGPSFLTKLDNVDAGVQVNVINFGYLFNSNVGITSSALLTSYTLSSDVSIGITGFMVGPLFSFAATPAQKVEFDIRPTIGYATGMVDGESTNEHGFSFGLGGTVRWNCWSRVGFSGNLDYYNMVIKEDEYKTNMSSFGVTIGVNFRF